MDNTFSNSSASLKDIKGIKKIVDFMSRQNFSHPIINYACTQLAITSDQLIPKSLAEFEEKNSNKEVNLLRYQHHEARRKARINVIAEFLYEKKLFLGSKINSTKKTMLTPSPNKLPKSSDNSPSVSYSQEASTERKVLSIKHRIIKRLVVQENQKKIKEEEEESRKTIEQKVKDKEKREKVCPQNSRNYEIRDKRIKERIEKKLKDVEEHEIKAMKEYQPSGTENKSQYQSYTPPHRYVEVSLK